MKHRVLTFTDEDKQDEKARKKALKEDIALIREREKLIKEEEALKAKIEKEKLQAEKQAQDKDKPKSKLGGLISPMTLTHRESESKSPIGLLRPKTTKSPPAEKADPAEPTSAANDPQSTSRRSSTSLSSTPNDEPATAAASATATTTAYPEEIISPSSPSGRTKVKSWFTDRFRRSSRAADSLDGPPRSPPTEKEASSRPNTGDEGTARSDSERQVALAGVSSGDSREVVEPVSPLKAGQATRAAEEDAEISSLSSAEEGAEEAKTRPRTDHRGLKDRLLERIPGTGMRAGEGKGKEGKEVEEAEKRDKVGALDDHPVEKSAGKEKEESVGRESRFSEDL